MAPTATLQCSASPGGLTAASPRNQANCHPGNVAAWCQGTGTFRRQDDAKPRRGSWRGLGVEPRLPERTLALRLSRVPYSLLLPGVLLTESPLPLRTRIWAAAAAPEDILPTLLQHASFKRGVSESAKHHRVAKLLASLCCLARRNDSGWSCFHPLRSGRVNVHDTVELSQQPLLGVRVILTLQVVSAKA